MHYPRTSMKSWAAKTQLCLIFFSKQNRFHVQHHAWKSVISTQNTQTHFSRQYWCCGKYKNTNRRGSPRPFVWCSYFLHSSKIEWDRFPQIFARQNEIPLGNNCVFKCNGSHSILVLCTIQRHLPIDHDEILDMIIFCKKNLRSSC